MKNGVPRPVWCAAARERYRGERQETDARIGDRDAHHGIGCRRRCGGRRARRHASRAAADEIDRDARGIGVTRTAANHDDAGDLAARDHADAVGARSAAAGESDQRGRDVAGAVGDEAGEPGNDGGDVRDCCCARSAAAHKGDRRGGYIAGALTHNRRERDARHATAGAGDDSVRVVGRQPGDRVVIQRVHAELRSRAHPACRRSSWPPRRRSWCRERETYRRRAWPPPRW